MRYTQLARVFRGVSSRTPADSCMRCVRQRLTHCNFSCTRYSSTFVRKEDDSSKSNKRICGNSQSTLSNSLPDNNFKNSWSNNSFLCDNSDISYGKNVSKTILTSDSRLNVTVTGNVLLLNACEPMYLKRCDVYHRNLSSLQCNASLAAPVYLTSRNYGSSKKGSKDVSKVKQTITALQQEKEVESASKEQLTTAIPEEPLDKQAKVTKVAPKKSIAQIIVKEVKHYYHGFRLLFIDIKVAVRYSWYMLRGKSLSRRERRQLVKTTADIFRLVPFLVFVVVPFMEFFLPFALKLFPGMLPSTFKEANKEEEKVRKKLKVKLEMAKFLQDTLEEIAVTKKGAKGETVQEFTNFMEKIRSTGEPVTNEDIIKYSQLFEDEITLDNLSYPQLRALCKLLDISVVEVSATVLRFQLLLKMRELEADDKMIQKEGIKSLEVWELQEACRARGMRSLGMSQIRLQEQLQQWLDLHLKSKVPTSLLLLSRSLYLPHKLPTTDQLKATISELAPTATEEAKVKISEMSGDRVDPKAKIEAIKQEEQIILEEKEDYKKKKEVKELAEEQAKPEKDAKEPEILETPESEILKDTAKAMDAADEKKEDEISPEDLSDIEDILETVAEERSTMSVEKEDLQELKKDASEYAESVETLKAVEGFDELQESKASINLRKKVNNMIVQMDSVVGGLQKQKEDLLDQLETKEVKFQNITHADDADTASGEAVLEEISKHKKELIAVKDILAAVKDIQKISDDTKLQKIEKVTEMLDTDQDGIIDLSDALKVIELIGRENVNLNSKQMSQIIELLQKEEKVEEESVDSKLEDKMEKKSN